MTERSGGRGPKGGSRSNADRNSRPSGARGRGSRTPDSRGGGSRGKGEQGSRSRSGRPDRGGRDDRGGSRGRGRDDRPDRGGRDGRGRGRDDRNERGGRDDRGGSRGRGRDDRPDRGGRDDRGPRRDRGRDDREAPRTRRGKYNDAPPPEAGSKSWGGLARQGAARIHNDPWDQRDDVRDDVSVPGEETYERTPEEQAKYEVRMAKREAGERNRERLRNEAQAAIARSASTRSGSTQGPAKKTPVKVRDRPALVPRKIPDPKRHLIELLGESHGKRAWRDLNIAAEHLDAGRTAAAKPIANRLYKQASDVIEVAETYALTMYALGKWHDAIEVLEDVRIRTGQPDQNPVLADAHRAVGHWKDVEALWEELRDMSPASELVVEGRIVAAGALADQGELGSAVRLLSKGWKRPKRPQEHHLRRAYALADLYERAGESPRAKELFAWVAHHAPGFVDAKHRSS